MDFPPNSHKDKEKQEKKKEKPKQEPVVTGEVIKRKKSLGRRFKDLFFGGDFSGATRYVASDVLLPALRNLVVDMTTKGIERTIYGEAASRRRSDGSRSRYSYNNPINRDPRRGVALPDQPPYIRGGRRHDIGEIIIPDKSEAETIVERLTDIIDKYEVASVADLYELLGLPTNYVDNKWGWSSLRYVDIRQVRGGWLIDLPSVEPIDD